MHPQNTANPSAPASGNVISISGAGPAWDRWAYEKAIAGSALPPRARLVALVLTTHASRETGEWTLLVKTLSTETGQSRATVFRALADLEAAGFLVRLHRYGRQGQCATRYRLRLPGESQIETPPESQFETHNQPPLPTPSSKPPPLRLRLFRALPGGAVPGGGAEKRLGSEAVDGEAEAVSPTAYAMAMAVEDGRFSDCLVMARDLKDGRGERRA